MVHYLPVSENSEVEIEIYLLSKLLFITNFDICGLIIYDFDAIKLRMNL